MLVPITGIGRAFLYFPTFLALLPALFTSPLVSRARLAARPSVLSMRFIVAKFRAR